MKRGRWLALGALCAALGVRGAGEAPAGSLSLVLVGLSQDYLEPCGCGGRDAGGLARRAAMVRAWRETTPGAKVLVDVGDCGAREDRLPLIVQCLGYTGVDLIGLAPTDLDQWPRLAALLARHAVAATSVVPPRATTPAGPPLGVTLAPAAGWRLGVVSVAPSALALPDTADRCAAELRRLRADGCRATLLLTHLEPSTTEVLLGRLPAGEQPTVVAQATDADLPGTIELRRGAVWVPLSRRGRSFATVTFKPDGQVSADSQLVETGPRDGLVQAWVDDYYRRLRAGETVNQPADPDVRYPKPASCVPCHGRAVAAWRAHPHAHAVETLVQRQRDVAGCLRCHDEHQRRAGVRPPPTGDRGVQCATCHDGLEAHLRAPRAKRPTNAGRAGCESCHTGENSPRWDWTRYRASVVAACSGQLTSRAAAREAAQP